MTWHKFFTICRWGIVASVLIAYALWLVRVNRIEEAKEYHRDFVLPALERSAASVASRSAEATDISPILNQHIDYQKKVADAEWHYSLASFISKAFLVGFTLCVVRAQFTAKGKKKTIK